MRLRFGLGVQAALDAGIIRLQHIVIFPAVRTGLNDQITGGDHCHLHRVCINSQQPTPALTTHYELSQP